MKDKNIIKDKTIEILAALKTQGTTMTMETTNGIKNVDITEPLDKTIPNNFRKHLMNNKKPLEVLFTLGGRI